MDLNLNIETLLIVAAVIGVGWLLVKLSLKLILPILVGWMAYSILFVWTPQTYSDFLKLPDRLSATQYQGVMTALESFHQTKTDLLEPVQNLFSQDDSLKE